MSRGLGRTLSALAGLSALFLAGFVVRQCSTQGAYTLAHTNGALVVMAAVVGAILFAVLSVLFVRDKP